MSGEIGNGISAEVGERRESNLTEARKRCFESLEKLGLVSRIHNREGKELVVIDDMAAFVSEEYSRPVDGVWRERPLKEVMMEACSPIAREENWGKQRFDRTLFFLFDGVKVLSGIEAERERVAEGGSWNFKEISAKSMFYVPESREAALDAETVRNQRGEYYFYLNKFSHVGYSNDWLSVYPTKRDGFESGLSGFEVVVPAMIYAEGRGIRDGGGVLRVDSEIGKEKRQKISANWFVRNFEFKGAGGHEWRGSAVEMLKECGVGLMKEGLLEQKDLEQERKDRDKVGKNGCWYKGGIRYYIGKNLAGCWVKQVSWDLCVVGNKEGVVEGFDPRIGEKDRSRLIPHAVNKRGIVTNVSREVLDEYRVDLNTQGIKIVRYTSEGKLIKKAVKLGEILPDIIKFEDEVGRENFEVMSIEDTVNLVKCYKEADEGGKKAIVTLVKEYGYEGARLVVDGYVYGGLKMSEGKTDLAFWDKEILEDYGAFVSNLENLDSMMDLRFGVDDLKTMQYYFNRIEDSFKFGICSLLRQSRESEIKKVGEQMLLLGMALYGIGMIWEQGEESGWEKTKYYPEVNQRVGLVRSVVEYTNEGMGTLRMIFTPREVEGEGGKTATHARWGVAFEDLWGRDVHFRVDLDSYGASLDLGSQGDQLHRLLKESQLDHHTQHRFQALFRKPEIFAKFVENLAQISGAPLPKVE